MKELRFHGRAISCLLGVATLLGALFLGACSSARVQEAPDAEAGIPLISALGPGRVVAVGGALSSGNAPVYQAVLGARHGDGPICILPTATSSPDRSVQRAISAFERFGGEGIAVGVPISIEAPELTQHDSIAELLSTCSGYWFVGGQQRRIVEVFDPEGAGSLALAALVAGLKRGAVVAGNSAGAAVLSNPMISGGSSSGALERGVGSESGAGVVVARGGGFAVGVLLDQHFLARGRFARLVVALLDPSTPALGVGIDENTAFVIDAGVGTVLGASQAVFVDARDATVTWTASGGISRATGIRIELLAPNDRIDLSSMSITRPPLTPATPPVVDAPQMPEEPFERRVLQDFLSHLGLSSVTAAEVQTAAGLTLRFEKGDGFEGGLSSYRTVCLEPLEVQACWPTEISRDDYVAPLTTAGPFILTISGSGT